MKNLHTNKCLLFRVDGFVPSLASWVWPIIIFFFEVFKTDLSFFFRDEHDPGRASNKESAIKQHAETTDHDLRPRDAQILERSISDYGQRRRKREESVPSRLYPVNSKAGTSSKTFELVRVSTNELSDKAGPNET